jgi:putative ABC transport system permease protein
MMLRSHLEGAVRALRATPMRSLLTIGGLAVGIASLIGLAGLGAGFTSAVSDEMAALGTRLIVVVPRAPTQDRRADRKPPGSLVARDAVVLSTIPGVARALPVLHGEQVAIGPAGNGNLSLLGVGLGFAASLHLRPAAGRLLTESDESIATKAIVLGSRAARVLLGAAAASLVAQGRAEITFGHALLTVAGILEPVGSLGEWNIDESGFVSFPTARLRLLGSDPQSPGRLDALLVDLADPSEKPAITADIRASLRERHRIAGRDSSDFALLDLAASAHAEDAILRIVRLFLAVTAAATMLVGGVGIANIMLVAVSERTVEIGLLQALGARRSDILTQFLIEATLLALTGGLVGVALGLACGRAAAEIADLRYHIGPAIIAAAAFGAAVIGMASGLVPAMRAARLSPLAALRRPA